MAEAYQVKSISRPVLHPETFQPVTDAILLQSGEAAIETFFEAGLRVYLARRRDVERIPARMADDADDYVAKIASVLPSSFRQERTSPRLAALKIMSVFGKRILLAVLEPNPTLSKEHLMLNRLLQLSGIPPEAEHDFQFQIGLGNLRPGVALNRTDELLAVIPEEVSLDIGDIEVEEKNVPS